MTLVIGDCGQLPSKSDVYTILNYTYSTTVGSIIKFECVQARSTTDLKTFHQAKCFESGLWQPDPEAMCGQTTTNVEYGYIIANLVELNFGKKSDILFCHRLPDNCCNFGSSDSGALRCLNWHCWYFVCNNNQI